MSCFSTRSNARAPRTQTFPSDDISDDQLSDTDACRPPLSLRRSFLRPQTLSSRLPSDLSFASLSTPPPPPPEDLTATKRRLVLIRRQPSFVPVHLAVGFRSRTGWRPLCASRHNQDSIVVLLPLPDPLASYSFFAVVDGHGRAAHRVASFVSQAIPAHFRSRLDTAVTPYSAQSALRSAVLSAAADLASHPHLDCTMTGTTAAVMVVHAHTLVCANVGDSRIVLATYCKGSLHARALTIDHLPQRETEFRRVQAAGGRIDTWTPAGIDTGPPRVWLKDRRLPGLSMTRVIGDSILDGIVTAEPDIITHELAVEDAFAVVATDGLWAVLSNEEVVHFISERPNMACQAVCELLVRHAAALWFEQGGETIDDISVIIVKFNW